MPKAKSPRTPKPTTKPVADNKVLQMPENGSGASRNGSSPSDLDATIRLRAYELYVQRGYVEGFQEEDWLRAEREVLARRAHSA